MHLPPLAPIIDPAVAVASWARVNSPAAEGKGKAAMSNVVKSLYQPALQGDVYYREHIY